MVHVVHNGSAILKTGGTALDVVGQSLVRGLAQLAAAEDGTVTWCREELEPVFAKERVEELLHHDALLISYAAGHHYLPTAIGYVEGASFVRFPDDVTFPTWCMSANAGACKGRCLRMLLDAFPHVSGFDEVLHAAGKLLQVEGLICLSEPRLLREPLRLSSKPISYRHLFDFVARYKGRKWVVLLFASLVLFESKWAMISFLRAVVRKRINVKVDLSTLKVSSRRSIVSEGTIDVVIPTIGRKPYLWDVLSDLAQQDHLPKRVIIVEQNPEPNGNSLLDYLETTQWPFSIKHVFLRQAGACNARNVALEHVASEWVFFADDDIRLPADTLSTCLDNARQYGAECLVLSCLSAGVRQLYPQVHQTIVFGSGCSFVKRIDPMPRFKMELEFGYGEDTDYGMQLRYSGRDVLYFPKPALLHLNAPIGGFRTKFRHPWEEDAIQPKPAPTLLFVRKQYDSVEQVRGYKLQLFLRSLKSVPLKELPSFLRNFWKRWNAAVTWASRLAP